MTFPGGFNSLDPTLPTTLQRAIESSDRAQLRSLFKCAFQNHRNWDTLPFELRYRLVRIVEKNEPWDRELLEMISTLSIQRFNQIFDDVKNRPLINFFEGNIKFFELPEESLKEFYSIGEFLKYASGDENVDHENLHSIVNSMLFIKAGDPSLNISSQSGLNIKSIRSSLNKIEPEYISDKHLVNLIRMARYIDAQSLLDNCYKFLKKKIGKCEVSSHNDGIIIQIENICLINQEELKKYIKIFRKSVDKIQVALKPHYKQGQEVRKFLKAFKNDVISLDYSSWDRIPKSIGRLKNLRTLDVNTSYLKRLPVSIGKLENLRHLNLTDCWSLVEFPQSIKLLKNLEEVRITNSRIHFKQVLDQLNEIKTLKVLSVDDYDLLSIS